MSDQLKPPIRKKEDPWVAHALSPGYSIMEYEIERTLGGGGFGITYLARDVNLNLPVAVKEYLPSDLAMRTADGSVQPLGEACKEQFSWGLERFLSEARVLATFRHPNIVRALRYFPANGTAYIVMEFESGETLKKWLSRQSQLDRQTLLNLIYPLLDGLEVIHQAGFLHRDIKPDNIYMRSDNSPVLIDFGSARSTKANGDTDMTSLVSPGFAPLEQYQTQGNQGPWTDLYSLAAVMYWLVSGLKPMDSIGRLKQDTMVPAIQLDRFNLMGEQLLGVIDWALNPEETQRPQNVAEFRKRLHELNDHDSSIANTGRFGALQNSQVLSGWGVTDHSGKITPGQESLGSNFICTILFMDIIEYSKTSVNEQYQLKSFFNQLIVGKLSHIAETSRITLDTGDGAAICFMGDPEEVLYSAMDIQRALVLQDRLFVRMGMHLGPVRILNSLNGQKNVIGDGMNVAQRVMSFSGSNTLVVSRAFYDVAACLSDNGDRSFRYLGKRSDKHNRMHEIYSVITGNEGYTLADRTITLDSISKPVAYGIDQGVLAGIEKELAQYLGPLATVLIRKLKHRASCEAELRQLLSSSISNPAQRELFIRGSNSHERLSGSSATTLTKSGSNLKIPLNTRESITQRSEMEVSRPTTIFPSWLGSETCSLLEKYLAQAVGPMARVLIKKESAKAVNLQKLCVALSLHIDNEKSRTKFLRDTSSLRK